MSTTRPDLRFLRTHHLRKGGEFQKVVRNGRRHQDQMFTVHAYQNGLQHARLGLTVSRRVSTRAVRRNRLKRLIRESFRHHQADLKGLDIVVVARSQADKTESPALRDALQQHWQSLQTR